MEKKEAMKILKDFYDKSALFSVRTALDTIIPELKESEDEKIKELIHNLLTIDTPSSREMFSIYGKSKEDVIAWLEKQGNKPQGKSALEAIKEEKVDNANKVESKFKIGDWIINKESKEAFYIRKNLANTCEIVDIEGNDYHVPHYILEEDYRLWSIKDVKDGDVLFHSDSASNGIFIFKEILQRGIIQKVVCYCDYDSEDGFCLGEKHTCCWADSKILHPATKEQRDTLLKAMTDAGYTFDFVKKELKKTENKNPLLSDFFKAEHERGKADAQKLAEWSEEDEKKRNLLIDVLNVNHPNGYFKVNPANTLNMEAIHTEELVDWLKSLRPQNQWKPSDEQIDAFKQVYDWYNDNFAPSGTLTLLYNDLKKLREE